MTVYLILHSNGLVFSFIRMHFSRVSQFFQGHYGNSVLLSLPDTDPHNIPRKQGCAAIQSYSRGKYRNSRWMRNWEEVSLVLRVLLDLGPTLPHLTTCPKTGTSTSLEYLSPRTLAV